MNLRWLPGNFADPQYGLSWREQLRLSNQAHLRFLSPWAFLWRTVLIAVPWLALLMLVKPVLRWMGYGGQNWPYLYALGFMIVILWVWSAWMYRSLYIQPLRRPMRDAGYDLCLGCGYELRGLDDSIQRCPECGDQR